MREKYFSSILRQDAVLFDKTSPGEVSSYILSEIVILQEDTNEKFGIVINSVSFFIVAYAVATIKDQLSSRWHAGISCFSEPPS